MERQHLAGLPAGSRRSIFTGIRHATVIMCIPGNISTDSLPADFRSGGYIISTWYPAGGNAILTGK
jgi:hypothetical protein